MKALTMRLQELNSGYGGATEQLKIIETPEWPRIKCRKMTAPTKPRPPNTRVRLIASTPVGPVLTRKVYDRLQWPWCNSLCMCLLCFLLDNGAFLSDDGKLTYSIGSSMTHAIISRNLNMLE